MRDPTPKQIREVMRALGKRTSAAKKAASRENGKKGGRPAQTAGLISRRALGMEVGENGVHNGPCE